MEKKYFIQSYGRRRSRGISQSQEFSLRELYKLYGISNLGSSLNPKDLFNQKIEKIIFEIGFGNGVHLINAADINPSCGFIGSEPFENGVSSTLKKIHEHGLKNVKVFMDDVRILLDFIENESIDRCFVLFPDPWPKKKHAKRRLLSKDFLSVLYEKISPGGDLIVATDSKPYMEFVLENAWLLNSDFEIFNNDLEYLSNRPSCFIETKYEQKAIQKGDRRYYLKIRKKYQ